MHFRHVTTDRLRRDGVVPEDPDPHAVRLVHTDRPLDPELLERIARRP